MGENLSPIWSLIGSSRQAPDTDYCLNNYKQPGSTKRESANKDQNPDHDIKIPTAFPIHPTLPKLIYRTISLGNVIQNDPKATTKANICCRRAPKPLLHIGWELRIPSRCMNSAVYKACYP